MTILPGCPPPIIGQRRRRTASVALQQLGQLLRDVFADIAAAPLPPQLQTLLDRMGEAPDNRASDTHFRAALAATMPQLRGYGRSLSGSADMADDLVQDTMVRAWRARDRFVPGTSLRAWTHVILRNQYFSQVRRARFTGEWDDHGADLLLAVAPAQEGHVALADLHRALTQLPPPQREALILVGASGFSCEEVAAISQCAVGTVKSRVARARATLRHLLDNGQLAIARHDMPNHMPDAFKLIMAEAEQGATAGNNALVKVG